MIFLLSQTGIKSSRPLRALSTQYRWLYSTTITILLSLQTFGRCIHFPSHGMKSVFFSRRYGYFTTKGIIFSVHKYVQCLTQCQDLGARC